LKPSTPVVSAAGRPCVSLFWNATAIVRDRMARFEPRGQGAPSSTIRLSRPFMASKTGAGRVAGGSGDAVAPSVHRHQAAVRAAGSRGARLCARARRATIRSWLPSPHACLPIRDMATYVQVDNPALGGHQPIASAWRLYVPKPVGLPPEGRILWAERKTHGAGAHDQETNP